MTTFFTLPTLPMSGRRPCGIPVTSFRRPRKGRRQSVHRLLTWGFTSRWVSGRGRLRTPDRTALEVVVGELESALDALAADDLDDLAAPHYLDRTRLLVRARNRIDAELARTTRRAELAQAPEYDG